MPTLFAANSSGNPRYSRFAIGIFILLLIASVVVGHTVYRRLVASEEQYTEETLNHIADIQTAAVSAWVLERLADAAVFSSGRFLGETMHTWLERGAPEGDIKQQMREQLQAIKATYSYLEAAILDTAGNIRISTEEIPAPLNELAHQTVQRAITTNSTQVSSVHSTDVPLHAKRVVEIAAPLMNLHERTAKTPSILLLRANADMHLDPFVQSMPLMSASTEVLLAEIRDGQVVTIAASENASHFGDNDVLPITPDAFLAESRQSTSHFLLTSMPERVAVSVARKVAGVPWYLVAMVDQNAARANIHRLAWIVAGSGAGVLSLLGIALLSWWKERESQFRFQTLQADIEKELLQRRYDYLSKYANDMIILADADEHIVEVNDTSLRILGRNRASLIGLTIEQLFLPACKPQLEQALVRLNSQGTAVFEVMVESADRIAVPIEVSARVIEFEGRRIIQLICRDASERKRSEAALRESKERLNGILASILDVVWSFSPDLARLNYINQSVEKIYGYPAFAFIEHPHIWFDAIHPEDRLTAKNTLLGLSAEQPLCDVEFRIIRRDDTICWLHCRGKLVADEQGRPLRIDGVSTDITQRKTAEHQVQILAYYDSVTMLPNRRLLNDRLAQAMHMATRSEKKVALLFMDLDNFKNINDSLGHHIGDMLLRAIAERLLQCVREEDTVARIGGDEFLLVLPDIERSTQAVSVAEKILVSTARPFMLQDQQIHTTISIGISVYPDDAREPNELIRHADSALYQAKSHGRDNYQFFTQELNYQITRSSNIERQLREAIDAGCLCLWYQPQIDTRSGRLIGAEALLRWRRNDRDYLSPVEFIPVAEERGLIGRIGEWAMREACLQCRRWQLQGLHTVPIAVNVSPIQFQQKGFADLVTGILGESQLDASFLELEITESAIMRRASQVAELAMRLREVGVGISIDDFGTGYSSLSYLKQIPIDKIKIDRSFIADMLTDVDDDAITYAIVNLAHSLNLHVIAEGVESKAQIDRLRTFGCNQVQGYYYSSAVSAHAFERFLADGTVFPDAAELKH